MNCRPGDLCRIVGLHPELGLNDHFVTLQRQPPMLVAGWILWRFEQPIHIITRQSVHDITGTVTPAGQRVTIAHMADEHLRPIRDPGENAVDEVLIRVGLPTDGVLV